MRALLDACVLAPLIRREMLLAAARVGLFAPLWSARIEEEWARAAQKEARGLPEALARGDIACANAAFPSARVVGWEPREAALLLPDIHDRHVLAAAIEGGARLIVTENIRDFPKRALAKHGLTREPVEPFLLGLAEGAPDRFWRAVEAALEASPTPRAEWAELLKRGRLPRLAKAARMRFVCGSFKKTLS